MKRYTLFLLAVAASAATAIAAIAPPSPAEDSQTRNITVIEKNQAFPLIGPLIVEDCATEDCSTAHG